MPTTLQGVKRKKLARLSARKPPKPKKAHYFVPWHRKKPRKERRKNPPAYRPSFKAIKSPKGHGIGMRPNLAWNPVPKGFPPVSPFGTYVYYSGYYCTVEDNSMFRPTKPIEKTKVSSSVSTPNFRLVKRRNLPWNSYSLKYVVETKTAGSWFGYSPNNSCKEGFSGYIFNRLPHTNSQNWPAASYETENIALGKALNKAKNMKVNLAQAFGERKQTVGLMITSVNRLLTAAIAIRNGHLSHAATILGVKTSTVLRKRKNPPPDPRNLANYWLEFQYGWRPLLSDIYGSAEHLANMYYAVRPTRVQAKSEASYPVSDHFIGQVSGPTSGYNIWGEFCTSTIDVRSKVIFEFQEDDPIRLALSQTGISNPALLAWELLPYSFVVDWFVPVGNYLSTIDATTGLHFVRGMTYTVVEQNDLTDWRQISEYPPPSELKTTMQGNLRTRRLTSKKRTIHTSFPTMNFPAFKPKLGIERGLSAISLLSQLFSGKSTVR